MMQVKPKTLEAYEYIRTYEGLTDAHNLTYHRWLKDGEALVKKSPADGYILQGFAYILMGQPKQALKAMDNAKKLRGEAADLNVMHILYSMGRFDDSATIAHALLQKNPHDTQSAYMLLNIALRCLDTDKVEEAMQLYRGGDEALIQKSQAYTEKISQMTTILQELAITKQTVIAIFRHIYAFLSDKYIGPIHLNFEGGYTEVGGYFAIEFCIYKVTIEQCLDLQEGFLDKLIDSELDFADYKNILVNFVPHHVLDDKKCQ